MGKTSIQWTDATWNPVRGCSKVAAGCANCYAERFASRFSGPGLPYEGLIRDGHWASGARFVPEMLDAPLHWKEPRRVFVNSMSDLFHDDITNEQIAEVFGVMAVAASRFFGEKPAPDSRRYFGPHTFQVLTKRANRLRLLGSSRFRELVARAAYRHAMDRVDAGWLSQCISGRREPGNHCTLDRMWPLPNAQVLVSCEDQATANERIPLLRQCPAAVRGVSLEPLLGPVDLRWIVEPERLDWVIVGAETGPHRRSCDWHWIAEIVKQCRLAGVPCFVKQIEVSVGDRTRVSKDPDECGGWPSDLRVRMYPGDKWQ